MNYTTRLAMCFGFAMLGSCGEEVCLPVANCISTLTIHVRDEGDAPVNAFRGTLEAYGVVVELECPGSQSNVSCGAGRIELFATPTEVSAELTSSDGYLRGSLTVRPEYFETDKEQSCRSSCLGGYTRVVLR